MPEYPQGQQTRSGGFPALLAALFYGLGYSVEVVLHQDIGQRRCRDMGAPLLVALSVLVLLTLTNTPAPPSLQFIGRPAWRVVGQPPHIRIVPVVAAPPSARAELRFWLPLAFCGLVVLHQACHRIRAWWRSRRRGTPMHSHYTGRPDAVLTAICRLFYRGLTELGCKRFVEPVLTFAIGIAVAQVSPLLGFYLVLAAGVMHVNVSRRVHEERELVIDATDGRIDMLTHQESVAAAQSPPTPVPAVARVVAAAAVPRNRANAAVQPQRQVPVAQSPAVPAVPASLCEGLNENLLRLLQEGHHDG